jgi:hypothetical protein
MCKSDWLPGQNWVRAFSPVDGKKTVVLYLHKCGGEMTGETYCSFRGDYQARLEICRVLSVSPGQSETMVNARKSSDWVPVKMGSGLFTIEVQ